MPRLSVEIGRSLRQHAKNPWDQRQVLGSLSGLSVSRRVGSGPEASQNANQGITGNQAGKKADRPIAKTTRGFNPQRDHQGSH